MGKRKQRLAPIPRKNLTEDSPLHVVGLDSRDAQEVVGDVMRSYLNYQLPASYTPSRVKLINNKELQENFTIKKKIMKNEKMTSKELGSQICFRAYLNWTAVENIAKNGFHTKENGNGHILGLAKDGVNLLRHADVALNSVEHFSRQEVHLIVAKIILGRCKAVQAMPGTCTLEPTPNYDCHVSSTRPRVEDSRPLQSRRSVIYVYEYTEECLPSPRPRQILPYAVVTFSKGTDSLSSCGKIGNRMERNFTMFGCSNQSWNAARVGPSGKGSGKRKEVKPKPQNVSAAPPLSSRTTPQVKRGTTCSSSVKTGNTGATGGTERLSAFDIVECNYLIGLEEGRFSPSFEEDFSSDSTVSADRGSLSNKDETNTGDTSMAIGPTQREFSNSTTEIDFSSETVADTHGSLFSQRCFAAGDTKDQAIHSGTSNRLEERNVSQSEKDLSSTSTYSATHPHTNPPSAQASTSNNSAKKSPTESASPSGSISHSGKQEDDSSGPCRVLDSSQQLNQVYQGSKNVTSACIVQGLKEGTYSLAAMGVYKGVVTACVDIDESSDEELIPIEEIKDDDEEDVVMQCSQNQDPCIDLTDEKDCINISSEEESDPQCLFSNIQTPTRPLQSCTSQSHSLPSTLEYPPSAPCEANQLPDQAYSSPNPTDHLLVQPHCQPSPPDHPSKLSCLLPFSSQHLQDQPHSQLSPTQHPSSLSNSPPHTSQYLQDQAYSPTMPTQPSPGLPHSQPSPIQHPSCLSNPPPHSSQYTYLQDQAYSPTSPTHHSPGRPHSQPSHTQHSSCLSNPPPHSSQYLQDQPYSPSSPTHPSPGLPHSQPPCSSHNHPNPSNPPVSSARSQPYSTSSSWRSSLSAFSPLWPSPSPVCSPRSPSPSVSSPKPYLTSSSLRYSHSACSPLWPSPSPLYSPRTPSPSLSSPSPAFSPLSIAQHTPSPLQQSPSPAYSPLSPPKEPLRPHSSSLSLSQHIPSPAYSPLSSSKEPLRLRSSSLSLSQHIPSPAYSPLSSPKERLRLRSSSLCISQHIPSPAYSPLSSPKEPLRLRSSSLGISQHTSNPLQESPSPAYSPLSPPKQPLRLLSSSLGISQHTSNPLQESPSPAYSPLSPTKQPLTLSSSPLSIFQHSPSPAYSPLSPTKQPLRLRSSPLSISQHTSNPLQESPSPAYSPLSPPKEPLRLRSSPLSVSHNTSSPLQESPSPAYSPLSPPKEPLRLRSSPSPAYSPLSPPKEPLRLRPSPLSVSHNTSSPLQQSPSPAYSPLSPPKEPLRLRSSRLSSEGNLPISLCSGPSQRSPLYPPSSTLQPSPSLVFLSPSLSRPSPCVSKNPLGLGMLYRPPHLLQQSSSVPFSLLSHPPQHQADMKGDKTSKRAEVSDEENKFDRRHGEGVGNIDNTPSRAQLPMPQILYTTNPVLQVSPRVHTMTWENQSEQEKRDIKNRFLTTEVKNYLSQFGDLHQVLRALDKPPVSLDEWKRLKSTCEANDLEMEKLHLQQLAMKQDLLEHGWSEEKQESHQAAKEKMWLLKLKKEMLSFERDSVLAHHFCKPGHPVPADLLLEAEHGQISSMEGVPLILKVSIPKRSYVVLRTIKHFIETIEEKHLTGAPDSLKAMLHGDRKTILRSLTYHGNYRDTSVMLGKRIAWYKEVQVKLRQLPPPQTLQEDFIKERLATLRRATDTIRHCKDEGDLSSPEQQPNQERLREACRGYSLLCAEKGRNFGAPISHTYREKLDEPGIVYSAGGIDQRGEDDVPPVQVLNDLKRKGNFKDQWQEKRVLRTVVPPDVKIIPVQHSSSSAPVSSQEALSGKCTISHLKSRQGCLGPASSSPSKFPRKASYGKCSTSEWCEDQKNLAHTTAIKPVIGDTRSTQVSAKDASVKPESIQSIPVTAKEVSKKPEPCTDAEPPIGQKNNQKPPIFKDSSFGQSSIGNSGFSGTQKRLCRSVENKMSWSLKTKDGIRKLKAESSFHQIIGPSLDSQPSGSLETKEGIQKLNTSSSLNAAQKPCSQVLPSTRRNQGKKHTPSDADRVPFRLSGSPDSPAVPGVEQVVLPPSGTPKHHDQVSSSPPVSSPASGALAISSYPANTYGNYMMAGGVGGGGQWPQGIQQHPGQGLVGCVPMAQPAGMYVWQPFFSMPPPPLNTNQSFTTPPPPMWMQGFYFPQSFGHPNT